jgi:hypothetical protein
MHIIRYSVGVLALYRNCSILIEPTLAGKAAWENDLCIAPTGLTNSILDLLGLHFKT